MPRRTQRPEFYANLQREEALGERDLGVAAVFHVLQGLSDKILEFGVSRAAEEARLFRRKGPDFVYESDYTVLRDKVRQILKDLDLLYPDGSFKMDGSFDPRGN